MMQQVQQCEAKAGQRKSLVRSLPITDWPAADRRGGKQRVSLPGGSFGVVQRAISVSTPGAILPGAMATIWISSIAQANLTLR